MSASASVEQTDSHRRTHTQWKQPAESVIGGNWRLVCAERTKGSFLFLSFSPSLYAFHLHFLQYYHPFSISFPFNPPLFPPSMATNTSTSAKKSNETTLTQLTKRFVRLLNSSSERIVNLNDASTRLSVAKRRIYDITNVLEGIGLLHKTSKNLTKWIDCPRDSPFAAPPQSCNVDLKQQASTGINDAEFLALLKTYQSLDEGVKELEAKIRQQLNAEGAYVTYHDIKSYFNDQIVIAVKAPPETRLEVNESLQIWMKSENGQIEVYLCPQNATNNNVTQPQIQHQNGHQTNTSPFLQQSQLSNSSNTQPLDATVIAQQQPYTAVSSDEGRGRSTISTTDGQYYDPTSGVSNEDHYFTNDPTLSSALSGTSEDEDPFRPLVPFEAREETQYNFMLDENYTITSLFPEDNLGIY